MLYRLVAHALYARHSEETPMLLVRIDEAGAIDAARTLAEGLVAEAAARAVVYHRERPAYVSQAAEGAGRRIA